MLHFSVWILMHFLLTLICLILMASNQIARGKKRWSVNEIFCNKNNQVGWLGLGKTSARILNLEEPYEACLYVMLSWCKKCLYLDTHFHVNDYTFAHFCRQQFIYTVLYGLCLH